METKRSEQKPGNKEFMNTHSLVPAVPERVGGHVQANSKRKCPSDNGAEEHACTVEPGCQ